MLIVSKGYAPIGARNEKLEDVPKALLDGLSCEEVEVAGSDGVKLAGISVSREDSQSTSPPTILLYLQGMFPLFSDLLPVIDSTRTYVSKALVRLRLLIVNRVEMRRLC